MYEIYESTGSTEYEMNADTLDQLYKEQLHTLRDLVFRQNCTNDMELCRKWLKVFSKTSKAEKMARNCLCSLMQQQLLECGMLGEPFTNLQNCNRDLERVLRELDEQSSESANFANEQLHTMRTFHSHREHFVEQRPPQDLHGLTRQNIREVYGGGGCAGAICTCGDYSANGMVLSVGGYGVREGVPPAHVATGVYHYSGLQCLAEEYVDDVRAAGEPVDGCNIINELSTECEDNEKQTKNLALQRELETVRLQLTEKQIENARLKEIAEKYQLENTSYEEVLGNVQELLLFSTRKTLSGLNSNEEQQFPFKIFEGVFSDFVGDAEFAKSVREFDNEFQQLLAKHMEQALNKQKEVITRQIWRKQGKKRDRLRHTYERRLRVQSWAQRLQLKLVKLKCFSALRQMFISTRTKSGNEDHLWKMLRVLEEKYQSVVDEIQ